MMKLPPLLGMEWQKNTQIVFFLRRTVSGWFQKESVFVGDGEWRFGWIEWKKLTLAHRHWLSVKWHHQGFCNSVRVYYYYYIRIIVVVVKHNKDPLTIVNSNWLAIGSDDRGKEPLNTTIHRYTYWGICVCTYCILLRTHQNYSSQLNTLPLLLNRFQRRLVEYFLPARVRNIGPAFSFSSSTHSDRIDPFVLSRQEIRNPAKAFKCIICQYFAWKQSSSLSLSSQPVSSTKTQV